MRIIDYKAMLFGFMYGDGWLTKNKHNCFNCGFSGDKESLEIAKKDLMMIYGSIGKATIKSRHTQSPSLNIYGTTTSFCVNTNVSRDFYSLGMPIGKKVEQEYLLPDWITQGDIDIKKYFISGYMQQKDILQLCNIMITLQKPLGLTFKKELS